MTDLKTVVKLREKIIKSKNQSRVHIKQIKMMSHCRVAFEAVAKMEAHIRNLNRDLKAVNSYIRYESLKKKNNSLIKPKKK